MAMWTKGKTKQVIPTNPKLQESVLNALGLLSKIVGNTLGPGGRPILLERDGLSPIATKDGVTVARAVNAFDATQDAVIECVKEVAERTGKQAGDGTTTSIILSEAIVRYGTDFLARNQSVSPQAFHRQLMSDFLRIKDEIAKVSIEVNDKKTMHHVALMSANGDDVVASAVVEAIIRAGEDGSIILEEAPGKEIETKVQDGFCLKKGLDFLGSIAQVFVNNEKDMECQLDRPLILCFNGTMRDINGVAKLVEASMKSGDVRPFVFVAHDFTDEVRQVFALNSKQGAVKMVPVMTPRDGTAMGKELVLQDLAAYTNATILDPTNLAKATLDDLGDCDKFRMSRWETVFIGEPDQQSLAARIANIKSQMEHISADIDVELYRERIARLTGGVTTIYVGGLSDLEVREARARVEDAVCAVRSALKQGVVPGGATTLLHLSKLDIHPVLKKALTEPIFRLLDNAGLQAGAITAIINDVGVVAGGGGVGGKVYNVLTHEVVDPWHAGILDPAKVIESAVGNAISVAGTLVTLGGVIVVARDVNLENQAALMGLGFDNMMKGGGQ